jgi:hypothetical protein
MSTYILICSITLREEAHNAATTNHTEYSWIQASDNADARKQAEKIKDILLSKHSMKPSYLLTAVLLQAHVDAPVWSCATGPGIAK